jgi:putative FmdB family regulatory protein
MPIYEYRCTSCGHELEVMQKVSAPAPDRCAKCEAENTLERLVSRTSFQLKGGGWYNDLYSSVKKEDAKPDSGAAAPAPAATGPSTSPAPASGATAGSTPAAAPAKAPAPSSSPSSSSSSSSGSGSGGSGT